MTSAAASGLSDRKWKLVRRQCRVLAARHGQDVLAVYAREGVLSEREKQSLADPKRAAKREAWRAEKRAAARTRCCVPDQQNETKERIISWTMSWNVFALRLSDCNKCCWSSSAWSMSATRCAPWVRHVCALSSTRCGWRRSNVQLAKTYPHSCARCRSARSPRQWCDSSAHGGDPSRASSRTPVGEHCGATRQKRKQFPL